MYKHAKLLKTGIVLLVSFSVSAVFARNIASEQLDSGGLTLSPEISYDSAGLRVSSDSSDTTSVFNGGESIRVDSGGLADGTYGYELSLATNPSESAPNGSTVQQNGSFRIKDGIASSNSDEDMHAEAEAEDAALAAEVLAASSAVSNETD